MLVLSRKRQESIRISDDIVVTVLEIQRNKVRLGIEAPKEIPVLRTELKKQILESSWNKSSERTAFDLRTTLKEAGQSCH